MLTICNRRALRACLALGVCALLYTVATAPDSAGALAPAGRPDGFPPTLEFSSAMFLYVPNVQGESNDAAHRGWIDIVSLDAMVSNTAAIGSGSGAAAGRAEFSEITVGKLIDKSSPLLHLHCCEGKNLKQIIIELCRPSGKKEVYMKYTLDDVIVSSVGPVTVTRNNQLEQVSFRYGRVAWEYTPTDSSGRPGSRVTAGWDLKQNKKI